MKTVVHKRADGSVHLRGRLTPEFLGRHEFANEDEGWAYVLANKIGFPPDVVETVELDNPSFPEQEFFNAWEVSGKNLVVNMAKARVVQENRVAMAKRAEAQRLIVRETAGEDVATEKTRLAAIDVGSQIAAAQTPAGLRAVWPPGLDR